LKTEKVTLDVWRIPAYETGETSLHSHAQSSLLGMQIVPCLVQAFDHFEAVKGSAL
jgi:hypothetical protein